VPSDQPSLGRRRFDGPPRVALEPPGSRSWLADAVAAGGGTVVPLPDAEALVWTSPAHPEDLTAALAATGDAIGWVQLPWAGIEPFAAVVDRDRLWTSGKGVYAEPVAEHALALALAGMRHVGAYARADRWTGPAGRNLLGARVVVLGAGGITESLLRLLGPFGCHVTVVRKRASVPVDGADAVVGFDELDDVLPDADLVVLALALTPETTGVIDARRLSLMKPTSWLVNVGRGGHVVTDDLVAALTPDDQGATAIGGAALDVTDPEPLPEGHPLWSLERCIVTPHIGNTPEMALPLLSERVATNVARFAAGEPLIGPVDPDLGY
jgi:phosphoglycerate dehydrogenase-like enzyme